jgi:hypothetical protein
VAQAFNGPPFPSLLQMSEKAAMSALLKACAPGGKTPCFVSGAWQLWKVLETASAQVLFSVEGVHILYLILWKCSK